MATWSTAMNDAPLLFSNALSNAAGTRPKRARLPGVPRAARRRVKSCADCSLLRPAGLRYGLFRPRALLILRARHSRQGPCVKAPVFSDNHTSERRKGCRHGRGQAASRETQGQTMPASKKIATLMRRSQARARSAPRSGLQGREQSFSVRDRTVRALDPAQAATAFLGRLCARPRRPDREDRAEPACNA